MPDLSPDQLDQLEALNEKRTPGPWVHEGIGYGAVSSTDPAEIQRWIDKDEYHGAPDVKAYGGKLVCESAEYRDREFIVALANAAPALLAAARQLQHTQTLLWKATNQPHTPGDRFVTVTYTKADWRDFQREARDHLALARAGEGGSSE